MSNIIDQAQKIIEANGFKDSTYRLSYNTIRTDFYQPLHWWKANSRKPHYR